MCHNRTFWLYRLTSSVVVLAVRSVDSRETSGCSLNVLSDHVLIEGEDPRCLAHELGHACGLWHHRSSENVMSPTCGGTKLKKWQRCVLRDSRDVSYL
jgi:hypothetical protein